MEEIKNKELNDLKEYREKLSKLSESELKQRDLYLKDLATGKIQGPPTGRPELDKPWLKDYDDEAILSDVPKMLIYDYIKECNKDRMDKTALNYYDKKISYQELFNNADEIVKSLKSYGIKKGDVVSLCLPTMPETFYMFLALNKLGAVANFIDPRINVERMKHCFESTNPKLIMTVDTYNETVSASTKDLNVADVISVCPADSLSPLLKAAYKLKSGVKNVKEFKTWNEFVKHGKGFTSDTENIYEENMPAAIVHTSGTTGIPKGAILSNDGLNGISFQQKSVLPDMLPGDTFLNIMPPFLSYGLACGLCTALTSSLESILIPKFKPEEFVDLLIKYKPNHAIGVPSFLETLIKSDKLTNENLSFLKYYVAGGDKMDVELERRINEFFTIHGVKHPVAKGYGMTELSSAVATIKGDETNLIGSAGIPMVKNNIKVIDTETKISKTYNQSGEIYVSGPTEMIGYTDTNEDSEVIIIDDSGKRWIKTGDYGKISATGNLYIEDRLKRMIIRPDGHNVFPSSIENVLLSHDGVDSCCVVGVKSEEYTNGEIPTACIVINDSYLGKEEELIKELEEYSLQKLPPRDVAMNYKIFSEIPKKTSGKIDYEQLKEEIEQKVRKL